MHPSPQMQKLCGRKDLFICTMRLHIMPAYRTWYYDTAGVHILYLSSVHHISSITTSAHSCRTQPSPPSAIQKALCKSGGNAATGRPPTPEGMRHIRTGRPLQLSDSCSTARLPSAAIRTTCCTCAGGKHPGYPRLSSACERARGLKRIDMDAGSRATCSSARRSAARWGEARTSCTLPCAPPCWPA